MLSWALLAFITVNATLGFSESATPQGTEVSARSEKIARAIADLRGLHGAGDGVTQINTNVIVPQEQRLLDIAGQSEDARAEVVKAVIDLLRSCDSGGDSGGVSGGELGSDYSLWVAACDALGELKATEAIDVLVEHLVDGRGMESILMPYPVPPALVKVGPEVIPKLTEAALKPGASARYRGWAVVVLGEIGGRRAMKALSRMEKTETDPYVLGSINRLLVRQP
jgi:hypothetical protein